MRVLVAASRVGRVVRRGLAISGMTDRFVVLGFLDIFGDWNPTLAFVMAACSRSHGNRVPFDAEAPDPAVGGKFRVPRQTDVDVKRLIDGRRDLWRGLGSCGILPGTCARRRRRRAARRLDIRAGDDRGKFYGGKNRRAVSHVMSRSGTKL